MCETMSEGVEVTNLAFAIVACTFQDNGALFHSHRRFARILSFLFIFILVYLKIVLLHGREKFSLLPGCIWMYIRYRQARAMQVTSCARIRIAFLSLLFTRHVSIARRASVFVFAARHQLIYCDIAII